MHAKFYYDKKSHVMNHIESSGLSISYKTMWSGIAVLLFEIMIPKVVEISQKLILLSVYVCGSIDSSESHLPRDPLHTLKSGV